jgi:hypothetical protein
MLKRLKQIGDDFKLYEIEIACFDAGTSKHEDFVLEVLIDGKAATWDEVPQEMKEYFEIAD